MDLVTWRRTERFGSFDLLRISSRRWPLQGLLLAPGAPAVRSCPTARRISAMAWTFRRVSQRWMRRIFECGSPLAPLGWKCGQDGRRLDDKQRLCHSGGFQLCRISRVRIGICCLVIGPALRPARHCMAGAALTRAGHFTFYSDMAGFLTERRTRTRSRSWLRVNGNAESGFS